MTQDEDFAPLPINALRPLVGEETADFAVYLPGRTGEEPVLYRRGGSELALPDFARLAEHGASNVLVRVEDLAKCEHILETKLFEVVHREDMSPDEKSDLIFHVGTCVASDLSRLAAGDRTDPEIDRAGAVVDSIIACVLADPRIASNLLQMSEHELSTASHMFAVSALSIMLGAKVIGPDGAVLKELGLAGMMHDLGKLAIPPAILAKTDPLTYEELRMIHHHPVESVRLLGDDPLATTTVRQTILQHHERVDGKGYPLGLGAEELLIQSRILTVVDSFHAMIGRRVYRRPLTAFEANQCLRAQSGKQFDADVVQGWQRLVEEQSSQGRALPINMVSQSDAPGSFRHEHVAARPVQATFSNRQTRHPCKGRLSVPCIYAGRLGHSEAPADEFAAEVSNVSTRGMCLSVPYPVYRGELLHIHLQNSTSDSWIRGSVAWCRPGRGKTYLAGMRFLERITDAQAKEIASVCASPEMDNAIVMKERMELMQEPADQTPDAIPSDSPDITESLDLLTRLSRSPRIPREDLAAVISLASSTNAEVRKATINVLARMPGRDARTALLTLLRDADPAVREHTVAIIGALRMQDATNALRALLTDPVDSVAFSATASLAKLGDSTAVSHLVEILQSDKPTAKLAARAFGETVGQRFAANAEGVQSARRYLQTSHSKKPAISLRS